MNRGLIALPPLALAAALLAACGGDGNEQGVGGVTADEAAQLNNAAEMLDASPDGLAAPENAPLESKSGSEDMVAANVS